MIGIALEIAVKFFWSNFVYTFGGEKFVQSGGGPIGARITICIARLIMQDWRENFNILFEKSKVREFLKGIYVDDGRSVMEKLKLGTRFDGEKPQWDEGYESEDIELSLIHI